MNRNSRASFTGRELKLKMLATNSCMNSSIMTMNLLDLPHVQVFPVFQTNLLAPEARCSVEEDKEINTVSSREGKKIRIFKVQILADPP